MHPDEITWLEQHRDGSIKAKFTHRREGEIKLMPQSIDDLLTWIGCLCCAVTTRHDYMVVTKSHLMYLQCSNCGKSTPGWNIDVRTK